MVIYKILETEHEYKQLEGLCVKHGLNAPNKGITIIAKDNNTLVGAITLQNIAMIEPLVSENPIVATKLFNMIEGVVLSNNINIVRCNTQLENENKFFKAGFNRVFENNIILEKIYGV